MAARKVLLSYVLLAIVGVANYVQHHLPAPVANAWFDENGLDMGRHELELQQYAAKWVYLTAQILCVLLAYHALSAWGATWGGPAEALACGLAPVCLGLGVVVYGLFVFFWVLMTVFQPRWRDQWTYYESLGYPYERWMHAMHNPLWLCPLVDALCVRDRRRLARDALGVPATLALVAAYVAFYAGFTTLNWRWTGCYVYPWMYDIDRSGYGRRGHVAYYGTLSLPVAWVVLGCRARLVGTDTTKRA